MLLSRLIILFLLVSNLAHCQDFLKKTFKENQEKFISEENKLKKVQQQ